MLTEKQQAVFDYLVNYISRYGKAPTLQEIINKFGWKSKRNATQYLEILEKKGYITRNREYRGIRIGNNHEKESLVVHIPILGYANAGLPLAVDPRLYN